MSSDAGDLQPAWPAQNLQRGVEQKSRVLVIGLDGATFDLLMPWMEEGRLPNISEIWKRSSFGYLRSTVPPITASAWATFQTGKNPGKHGLFDFTQPRPDSYESSFISARSLRAPSLWEVLSQHGKRVGVLNVPITYPPRPVNGLLVAGLMTPSTKVVFTYPPDLYQELVDEIGEYTILVPVRRLLYMGVRGFVDKLRDVTRKRAQAAVYLMRRCDWDFFMVHFHSCDVLQHGLWSHLDPRHPAYDDIDGEERDYVQSYYRDLDGAVGSVLAEAGRDTTTILMSDHGFGPAARRFHINQWLANEGLLQCRPDTFSRRVFESLEDALRRADVLKLRRRLIPPFSQRETLMRQYTQESRIDWSSSQAFALPCSVAIRLQINVRGREPLGVVEPGAEYERLRDRIAERLLEIRDPDTGNKVVQQVFKREEIYSGPALDMMPDLVALPDGRYIVATHFKKGLLYSPLPEDYSGSHRMEGMLMMAGPAIPPGRRIEGAEIADLFPTILHLLDVPVPSDLDGRALTGALDPCFVKEHPLRCEDSSSAPLDFEEITYSADDEAAIADRLRGMGYLG
jgi:predicted AlkP superfamily phosphohydrolase/phosphomutase